MGPVETAKRLALVLFLISATSLPVRAEDRVTVRTDSGAGTAVLIGRIVDWTGDKLRIRSAEDVREVDGDQVVDVRSTRSPKHIDGVKAFETGRPDDANTLLTEALAEEPREWMRREILAVLTRVDLARGERGAAMADFLSLVESDPSTRHYDVIPLDWGMTTPEASSISTARSWLRAGRTDTQRLLGASALLFDPADGELASAALNRLASAPDRPIFTLARAQQWRKTLARGDVSVGEIERWEDRLHEIPEPLRGGAYSLIGRAWADAGNPERAAAALLWLPLVYDADTRLTAESAVMAGNELAKIGRSADAIVLFREVVSKFPYAPAATEAKATLDRMAAAQQSETPSGSLNP